MPCIIKRPGKSDIIVLKYFRDSLDEYEDILQMVGEIWDAQRSSFLPAPSTGHEEDHVDIAFSLHLGMTTPVPEFRVETSAPRDGYTRPGEDGVYVDKEYFKKLGLPEVLESGFDNDKAVAELKKQFPVKTPFE